MQAMNAVDDFPLPSQQAMVFITVDRESLHADVSDPDPYREDGGEG